MMNYKEAVRLYRLTRDDMEKAYDVYNMRDVPFKPTIIEYIGYKSAAIPVYKDYKGDEARWHRAMNDQASLLTKKLRSLKYELIAAYGEEFMAEVYKCLEPNEYILIDNISHCLNTEGNLTTNTMGLDEDVTLDILIERRLTNMYYNPIRTDCETRKYDIVDYVFGLMGLAVIGLPLYGLVVAEGVLNTLYFIGFFGMFMVIPMLLRLLPNIKFESNPNRSNTVSSSSNGILSGVMWTIVELLAIATVIMFPPFGILVIIVLLLVMVTKD